jgi:hypothetical protein
MKLRKGEVVPVRICFSLRFYFSLLLLLLGCSNSKQFFPKKKKTLSNWLIEPFLRSRKCDSIKLVSFKSKQYGSL